MFKLLPVSNLKFRMSQYEPKDARPRTRAPIDPNNPNERRDKDNVIRVSTNRNTRFWIYLAKIYLKRYKEVELHGFGDAITSCVRVSENLDRFEYANFTSIQFVTQVVVRLASIRTEDGDPIRKERR